MGFSGLSQVESSIFELGAGGMIVYSTITMVLEVPKSETIPNRRPIFHGWSNVTFDSLIGGTMRGLKIAKLVYNYKH